MHGGTLAVNFDSSYTTTIILKLQNVNHKYAALQNFLLTLNQSQRHQIKDTRSLTYRISVKNLDI